MHSHFKKLRNNVHLTQEQVAHYLGVDQSLISKYEKGERSLNVSQIEKACRLLGVSYGEFYERKESELNLDYRGLGKDAVEMIAEIAKIALNILEMENLENEH